MWAWTDWLGESPANRARRLRRLDTLLLRRGEGPARSFGTGELADIGDPVAGELILIRPLLVHLVRGSIEQEDAVLPVPWAADAFRPAADDVSADPVIGRLAVAAEDVDPGDGVPGNHVGHHEVVRRVLDRD